MDLSCSPAKRGRYEDSATVISEEGSIVTAPLESSAVYNPIWSQVWSTQQWLSVELSTLMLGPQVHTIYNPLEYAGAQYCHFLRRFCQTPKGLLMLGMNPGPWGMAQTGVPFGEVNIARDWLGVCGPVSKPHNEHPGKPVTGLDCRRSEISGKKLWALLRTLSHPGAGPEHVLSQVFVHNYCPLLFLKESGCNLTPAEIKGEGRSRLLSVCDEALRATVSTLSCRAVLAVGRFVETRALAALKDRQDIQICYIPHPSPRNPESRKNWESICVDKLREANLLHFFSSYSFPTTPWLQ